jgi:hypothetical protein
MPVSSDAEVSVQQPRTGLQPAPRVQLAANNPASSYQGISPNLNSNQRLKTHLALAKHSLVCVSACIWRALNLPQGQVDIYGPFHAANRAGKIKDNSELAAFAITTEPWRTADLTTAHPEPFMVWFFAKERSSRMAGVYKHGDMVLNGFIAFQVVFQVEGFRTFEEVDKISVTQNFEVFRPAVKWVEEHLEVDWKMRHIPSIAKLVLNRMGDLDKDDLPVR